MAPAPLEADPERFFNEFHGPVRDLIAASVPSSPSEIDDLVQETLCEAWKDRGRFRSESSALTWVLGIARNRIRGLSRSRDRAGRLEEIRRALAAMAESPIPDAVIEAEETGALVRRALAELDPSYADVLVRFHMEGLSVRRLAQDLGETEKAVESRLHRARVAFRDGLLRMGETDA